MYIWIYSYIYSEEHHSILEMSVVLKTAPKLSLGRCPDRPGMEYVGADIDITAVKTTCIGCALICPFRPFCT